MAIYRNVHISFWTDSKVIDDFTPEDRYFYIYLLTNPHTNLCGCFEISLKQMSDELGYNKESIEKLIRRFHDIHELLAYDQKTKELLLYNWSKYNWTKSPKFEKALSAEIKRIKSIEFKGFLEQILYGNDTVSIPYQYTMDTTVTDTVTDYYDKDNNIKYIDVYKDIINYLNRVCGTNYKPSSKTTQKHIHARLNEGYCIDDFYIVIDKKAKEWIGTEWEKFLRPDTLFGTKFENYLNQKINKEKQTTTNQPRKKTNSFNNFHQRQYDSDEYEKMLLNTSVS